MKQPISLIPWNTDFLTELLRHIQEKGNLTDSLIIVPHSRPEMYIRQILVKSAPLPMILPDVLPAGTLFSTLRQHMHKTAASPAATLDSIGLLLETVREILRPDHPLLEAWQGENATKAPWQDAQRFFPWGLKLSELFEECFTHHCQPKDFQYMEGEVVPFAAALLDNLRDIYQTYVHKMHSHNWTTPGLDASAVVTALENGQDLPGHIFADKQIYIAGFHILNRTQEILFEHLQKKYAAEFIIHADPALALGKEFHWSCQNFMRQANQWGLDFHILSPLHQEHAPTSPSTKKTTTDMLKHHEPAPANLGNKQEHAAPDLEFIAGFDLHSQLQSLCQYLAESGLQHQKAEYHCEPGQNATKNCDTLQGKLHSADTAIILPDSGLLMPLLHHLPDVDCNISMGYPLSRSPIFALLDIILSLQEKRLASGFYWKGLLDLFRHPYLKMLNPQPAQPTVTPGEKSTQASARQPPRSNDLQSPSSNDLRENRPSDLRAELHRLEHLLREAQQTYLLPEELLQRLQGAMPETSPGAMQLLKKLFACCFQDFSTIQNTRGMGKALENLCSLLLEHGQVLWERFPIDAEGLHRILQKLIPELLYNSLALENFPHTALFSITRQLIHTQRVPFQASPLVGLQIMGMLESRLLTFKQVYILDSIDASLPGAASGNPLFPDSLRPILGLPPVHTREEVAAYHFFRLIKSAEKVVILWREGVTGSGLQDQIPQKSRFIEELLWEKEKKLGKLLRAKGDDPSLHFLESTVSPLRTGNKYLPVTEAMRDLVKKRLEKPISASFLDRYLQCPVRWYYEEILRLGTPVEIEEKHDPLAVGNLLHNALQTFYTPYIGQKYEIVDEDFPDHSRTLQATFLEELESSSLPKTLPADALAMLKTSAAKRLNAYLKAQPPTFILALEKKLNVPFTFNKQNLILTGRVDRIDFREDTLLILDYKTGHLPVLKKTWDNSSFWSRIELWQPQKDQNSTLLHEIYQNIPSLQLPFYIFMLEAEHSKLLAPYPLLHGKALMLDAAFVDLRESCKEKKFLAQTHGKNRQELTGNIATLISFIVRHMLEAPVFYPQKSELCHWCSAEKMCMVFRN